MKTTIIGGLLLALFALSDVATAADTTVSVNASWSIPTTREDGKALAATDLAGYQLYYSVDGGEAVKVDVAGGATRTATLQIPLDYRAERYTVGLTIVAVDKAGLVSKHSNRVTHAFTLANEVPPASPANIGFSVSCPNGCRVTVEPL